MPEVIRVAGETQMRWERWRHWKAGDPRWRFEVIDTDSLTCQQVAGLVLRWVTEVLAGRRPSLSGSWWRG
jgi:hypothetical protein